MTFLNPFVLFGLFASSIPLLLHLINLRKQKDIEFSTLRFLKELRKTEIKKLKLKQIILLILRILIIACIVFAFSRPIIQSKIPGFETYSNSSIVILLDNSSSMDYSDENGNRFSQAKRFANSIIAKAKEGDEIAIIELSGTGILNQYNLSNNIEQLKDNLQKLKVNFEKSNLDNGLQYANSLLANSRHFNKNIIVVSDMQKNIFQLQDSSKIDGRIGVIVAQIGNKSKKDFQNLAIDSLDVKTKIFQRDKLVEVEANIKNSSGNDIKSAVLSMHFNNQNVAQRTFDIEANKTIKISIAAPVKEIGANKARLQLESDSYETDNNRYFGFAIPEKPKVAVVGSPEKSKYLKIISGIDEVQNSIELTFYDKNQISSVNLDNLDLVALTSNDFAESEITRLQKYVADSGNLFIFADNSNTARTNFITNTFGFGEVAFKQYSNATKFSKVDKVHPIFEGVFTSSTDKNQIVETPEIKTAAITQMGNKVIELQDGGLFSENKIGFGKVIFFGLSADDSFSNLPYTGIFPTLLYRSSVYLATMDIFGRNAAKSSNLLNLQKKDILNGNLKIISPSGNNTFLQASVLATTASLDISSFKEAGVYTVYNSADKLISIFSVNVNNSESDLAKIDSDKIKKELAQRFKFPEFIHYLDDPNDFKNGLQSASVGTEIWKLFVILALLFAAIEMLVSRTTESEES